MFLDFYNHDYMSEDRAFYFSENNIKTHLVTLGTASYVSGIKFDLSRPNKSNILIGRFCSISSLILFSIGQNHSYKDVVSTYPFDDEYTMKKFAFNFGINSSEHSPVSSTQSNNHYQIIIGHDVWIGRNVTVRSGVKIGNGAIVGTSAVITKDVPPYAVVAGNPARVIKYRFDAETIKKFMAIKWWNWNVKKIYDNIYDVDDVEKFVSTYYKTGMELVPYAQIGGAN